MLVLPQSQSASDALALAEDLQFYFVQGLERLARDLGDAAGFEETSWLRDGGRHGGGTRFSTGDRVLFNRGSVNVSQTHYDDTPDRKLGSATALSTIIHPRHPHAPSMHMHISWTEMKGGNKDENGNGYWRMMADLNPSHEDPDHTRAFQDVLKNVAPDHYQEASAQGDRYFYIPALKRHRGVAHFYLENFNTGHIAADARLAQWLGEAVVDSYISILYQSISRRQAPSDREKANQLAYHTLYFFQVLTLDRGTTSGLLVHDQNDLGIMGSLPSHVDKNLLMSWRELLSPPQEQLLDTLLSCLPGGDICLVDPCVKKAIAQSVRNHYQKRPEALAFQATGNMIPATVKNHV